MHTRHWTGAVLAGALALAACDLGVTNPELIEEDDLHVAGAIPAIVNGARYSFGLATTIQGAGGVYSVSAILTDELTHVGSWVPPREISDGVGGNASPENQSHWGFTSRARWQAEDAIGKVSGLVAEPNSNEWVALATLYAGFANRVQGDMFCQAVINGGELLPHTAFFERGEEHLTNAITIAGNAGRADLVEAAYGARAQVRMMLGNWAGAVSDAGQVSTGFVYAQPHSDNTGSESNGVYEWSGLTSGQYAVWGTPFADWGLDLSGEVASEGDPRAPFASRGANDQTVMGGDNRRPFWFARKYTSRNDDIPIVKGTEMRLIEAEALLRDGNIPAFVDKINEVRTFHGLADEDATTADEAWQLLMKERGLELWLEGRRLADMRRWAATPAAASLLAGTSFTWSVRGMDTAGGAAADPRVPVPDASPFCLRISTNEIESNANLRHNPDVI